eukprot:TRINITY_DN7923_c0_g1_i5.p1 TRINITY_DN7923_c0_g1~~TRINITY_DN7923_c0_g1_i5.p1  ORF type:complete len:614 (-),score=105.44 TRINITY_DN7923_c0_g1_i5:281-2122(-)
MMLSVVRALFIYDAVVLGSQASLPGQCFAHAAGDSGAGRTQHTNAFVQRGTHRLTAVATAGSAEHGLLDSHISRSAAKATVAHRRSGSTTKNSTVDKVATSVVAAIGEAELLGAASEGVASLALCAVSGCSSAEMIDIAVNTAVGMAVTALGMINPVLGVVATMASTFFMGLFGGSSSQDDPMQALYDVIIAQVESMIQTALIQSKLDTVSDEIDAIAEELLWVPDLIATANSSDVEMSYLLTVQHSLALNSRAAFGDCYNDLDSDDCAAWEEAGTIMVANTFSEVQFQVLSSLYGLESTSSSFAALVQDRLLSVGQTYRPLLNHSYLTYETYRLSFIKSWVDNKGVDDCSYNGRSQLRKRLYQCKDTWTGTSYYWKSDCDFDESATYKAEAENACANASAALSTSMQNSMKLWPSLTAFAEDSCDASSAPSNGAVGNCTSSLASRSSCQPTCSTGYTVSGATSCSDGVLASAQCQATCSLYTCPAGKVLRSERLTSTTFTESWCCKAACSSGEYVAAWHAATSTATCATCTASCPEGKILDGTCSGSGMADATCRDPTCSESRGNPIDMNCNNYNNCNYKSDESNSFEYGSKDSFVAACCKQGSDSRRRRCR